VAYVTVTACNKNYLGFSLKQRKDTVKILLEYRRGVGRIEDRGFLYVGAEGLEIWQ
jgi:hypothetical protein